VKYGVCWPKEEQLKKRLVLSASSGGKGEKGCGITFSGGRFSWGTWIRAGTPGTKSMARDSKSEEGDFPGKRSSVCHQSSIFRSKTLTGERKKEIFGSKRGEGITVLRGSCAGGPPRNRSSTAKRIAALGTKGGGEEDPPAPLPPHPEFSPCSLFPKKES